MAQTVSRDIPVKESILQMNPVVFDELSFKRLSNERSGKSKIRLKLRQTVQKLEDSRYRVTIWAEAEQPEEYIATAQISGYCTINENDPAKEQLLKENALAILFPYIRSELTLLTAQPETEPIVWPVMNIQAMMAQSAQAVPDETQSSSKKAQDELQQSLNGKG